MPNRCQDAIMANSFFRSQMNHKTAVVQSDSVQRRTEKLNHNKLRLSSKLAAMMWIKPQLEWWLEERERGRKDVVISGTVCWSWETSWVWYSFIETWEITRERWNLWPKETKKWSLLLISCFCWPVVSISHGETCRFSLMSSNCVKGD